MMCSICCMMFNLLLQVRPCRDAVRCLLGEQLFRHVTLHPLCFLRLCLPSIPAHHLLLPVEGLWLWPRPYQVIHIKRFVSCLFFVCAQWVADQRQIYLSDTLVWEACEPQHAKKLNKITLAKITKVIFYRNYVRTNKT